MDLPNEKYVKQAIKRQQKLARAFREFMTRGQSFRAVNGNREEFYRRVIETAKKVKFLCTLSFCERNESIFQVQQTMRIC